MSGYTKLFSSIIGSSVWAEPNHVRIAWITLLAVRNSRHVAELSLPGLSQFARITMEEARHAIEVLSAPDPLSRTKEDEGRRIREVDGGWLLINGEKYRNKLSADDRREYKRIKQAQYRARDRRAKPGSREEREAVHAAQAALLNGHREAIDRGETDESFESATPSGK